VLAGLGEEPLFRSFVILALAKYWQGAVQIGRLGLSYASLLCGFIFMTAHVGYAIVPRFEIVHVDALQLTYTFFLGVAWASIFEKTKSLLAPVAAHIWANFIQYALGYATVYLLF
jgi:membrane protease YdiL (CAAX protease family)